MVLAGQLAAVKLLAVVAPTGARLVDAGRVPSWVPDIAAPGPAGSAAGPMTTSAKLCFSCCLSAAMAARMTLSPVGARAVSRAGGAAAVAAGGAPGPAGPAGDCGGGGPRCCWEGPCAPWTATS